MSLELEDFLITGRTFDEYAAFFNLDAASMKNQNILDCPSGASSFVAEAKAKKIVAYGCDILYHHNIEILRSQGEKSIEKIYANLSWLDDNDLAFYHSVEGHKEHRMNALRKFCTDFNPSEYHFAELPVLPYGDNSFDLVLSSHLLFVYDDRLDWEFHENSVHEMLRVGKEVRIFPLVDYKNSGVGKNDNFSPFAYRIAKKFGAEIIKVDFEFQKDAGYMMRIKQ